MKMNQLIVVNKPKNKTSRDIVNELNKIFTCKKIGHTGTLDPIATGVLVCVFGKYTKLVNLISSYDKEYIAEIKFGIKTDTLDITGNILEQKDCKLDEEKIKEVFKSFPKDYNQTVPKYSAVKINGKKLYEYARENIEINLPKRKVHIYELEFIKYENNILTFRTTVSKGTYIRSLIEDLCIKLNVIGTMNNLIRTKQGDFKIEDAYSIEDINSGNFKTLKATDFLDYPIFELDDETYKQVSNGAKIQNKYLINNRVLFTYKGEEVAIYKKEQDLLVHEISLL